MKKKFVKLICIVAIALLLPLLFACQSSIYLMRTETDEAYVYNFTLRLSQHERQMLDVSANHSGIVRGAMHDNAGMAWSVVDYLQELGARTGVVLQAHIDENTGVSTQYEKQGDFIILRFTRTIPRVIASNSGQNANNATHSTQNLVRINGFNPFIIRYRYTAPNPFNTLHAEFTAPGAFGFFAHFNNGLTQRAWQEVHHFDDGQVGINEWASAGYWQIDTSVGIGGVRSIELPNGTLTTRHYFYRHLLPSFYDAFPFAKSTAFNPNNFRVNFVMRSNNRYNVFGDDTSEYNRSSSTRYYTFTARFDGSDSNKIVFEFVRPNPIGWYIVAILVGVGVVVLIIVIVKIKRKKQIAKTCELIAYNQNDTFN